MKTVGIIAIGLYLAYLGFMAVGVGRLAFETTEEVEKITCRPDCKLHTYRGYPIRENCKQYCKEIRSEKN